MDASAENAVRMPTIDDVTSAAVAPAKELPKVIKLDTRSSIALLACDNEIKALEEKAKNLGAQLNAVVAAIQGTKEAKAEMLREIEGEEGLPQGTLNDYAQAGKELVKL